MDASENLADTCLLPGRCHPLTGDRKGQWALNLEYPYRLLFEPANDPPPLLENGRLDLARVTAVRVIGVEDYHGR